ncbi:hypothetical protein P9592_08440 [Bacillus atrophaeus]|uniref:hypothetical protein n=1 Tax=Bacillus atrophaeus TaxID=1452 RepID=UPI002E204548|nr:hypothetical protein [Bacillus atrophaeus]
MTQGTRPPRSSGAGNRQCSAAVQAGTPKRNNAAHTRHRNSDHVPYTRNRLTQSNSPEMAYRPASMGENRLGNTPETHSGRCTNALENSTAKVLITIPDHPYLLLKASLLKSTAEPGQIAVSFEPAAPLDTMPLLIDACGLTERETDITDRIIRGLSTKMIAEDLHIPPIQCRII